MKLFFALSLILLLNNCSFDNKTGIWNNKNEQEVNKIENILFKDFKKITSSNDSYKEIISLKDNYSFKITNPINNNKWLDANYEDNNSINFLYKNLNQTSFKSKKLSKYLVNNYTLFEDGNLIINDDKGNIIVFSKNKNEIIAKFNFYKKKFKRYKKNLKLIVENNIIYVADNLGYIYAYNYKLKKIIWAKNYKIPFSSNIKLIKNKIIISNQLNNLYVLEKKNGEILKQIPTEELYIKNQFENNIVTSNDKIFYLNTFGSLYSIDASSMSIDWFVNLNRSLELSPSNLFLGNKIVKNSKYIIVSSRDRTYIIDINTGAILSRYNFSSRIKPIINNEQIFFLTKNNFLIALNLNSKQILYSYNLIEIINLNKKINIKDNYKYFTIINNEINIFLKSPSILNFTIDGKFKKKIDLPSNIKTSPMFLDSSIVYLDHKNKLIVFD